MKKRVILFLLLLATSLLSREDYFYSFIDENSNQISQIDKDIISNGFLTLNKIKQLLKDGRVQEASKQLLNFKTKNNIEMLRSNMIILESEIGLKLNSKNALIKSDKLLEEAINRSYISEEDLPKAYMILIELKLALNKDEEAKYFIGILSNSFNEPIVKAYGAIYAAKMYAEQKDYRRAISVLYKILSTTNDINVATLIAYELFDMYVLDKKREEAYKLIKQVIDVNADYYSNDQQLVIEKVNKLTKNSMYDLAITTLENVIERTTNIEALAEYKFELAQVYMKMFKKGDSQLLQKAQELYAQVLNDYPSGDNSVEAKKMIDEILMRERKISPNVVNSKYPEDNEMRQKILLQELLNYMEKKQYEIILKSQSVYKTIPINILNRFGYKDLNEILTQVKLDLLEEYIKTNRCQELSKILDDNMKMAIEQIIFRPNLQNIFFECLLESPDEKNYKIVKDTLFNARDAQTYLNLENLAINLAKYEDAMEFSRKIDMLGDKEFLEKEFLLRFQIVNAMNNMVEQKKFFIYASNNENLIKASQNNPIIVDFYFKYYFYLLDSNQKDKAIEILKKLYDKQKELKVNVYSPTVEKELAKYAKENKGYQKALEYLQEGLKNTRNIKNNDLAEIYYDMTKLYELTNNTTLYDETLQKCKALDPSTTTTLYKKLCDELR